MKISRFELYQYLKSQNVTHLYHANTVSTSCTFINNNGLLSRGAIEKRGLFQTAQDSDEKDKLYDVWDDIFLDITDLHGHFPRQNFYGPVLFKFSLDILLSPSITEIWITKGNPIDWTGAKDTEKLYFKDINELQQDKTYPFYQRMITIRKMNNPLPFSPYLDSIILDNPMVKITYNCEGGEKEVVHLYKSAHELLISCLEKNNLSTDLLIARGCCSNPCYCRKNYLVTSVPKLEKLFLVKE